ncbi:hypothetical protein RUM44_009942 [Polyplax serrata]|uniref:SUI1 domain-containing protein n=1 Tax=Polyplax serrata TaxID=468196 RepID=A0ABR1AU45_POLSC
MAKKPRLIVFDLDFTLWPFYVDCNFTPPFRRSVNGEILDSRQRTVNCYKEVPAVLDELYSSGYQLAIASRTGEIDGANQLIQLFGWDKYFSFKEIYPGCKKQHFSRFKETSGIDYKDMLFFDDENRNITDIRSIGVTCVWVENGNLNTFDPFADAIKGADDDVQDGLVHIRIQQRNGRKTLTTVQGLSSEYDLKKIVRACKKEFACNGTVIEHPEYGEVLQLQGDQRENICQWLTKSGLAKPDQLKVHGF